MRVRAYDVQASYFWPETYAIVNTGRYHGNFCRCHVMNACRKNANHVIKRKGGVS